MKTLARILLINCPRRVKFGRFIQAIVIVLALLKFSVLDAGLTWQRVCWKGSGRRQPGTTALLLVSIAAKRSANKTIGSHPEVSVRCYPTANHSLPSPYRWRSQLESFESNKLSNEFGTISTRRSRPEDLLPINYRPSNQTIPAESKHHRNQRRIRFVPNQFAIVGYTKFPLGNGQRISGRDPPRWLAHLTISLSGRQILEEYLWEDAQSFFCSRQDDILNK